MKLLLVLVLFLQIAGPAQATHRLPLSHRTTMMQGNVSEPSKPMVDQAWKLMLLGLAALSFFIRKRL